MSHNYNANNFFCNYFVPAHLSRLSQPLLLRQPLMKKEKIAFVGSTCLGDALIAMVTVNNLVRNGYQVDVFSDYLCDLQTWFPWVKIFPQIKFSGKSNRELDRETIFAAYPTVMHMYDSELATRLKAWHPNSIVLSQSPLYKARISMVDIQVTLCQSEFNLKNVVRENNIQIPDISGGLTAHKYQNRIIVHPTSSLIRKNWPKPKFIKLAQKLLQLGYESHFIVVPHERADWQDVVNYGIALPKFASLSEIAAFIYESAFFIGNDSGVGHLASNVGVPTVSIILRPGVATQWRPTWAPGEVVLSPRWLNPRPIKEKLWKYFTTVNMVLEKFEALRIKGMQFNRSSSCSLVER